MKRRIANSILAVTIVSVTYLIFIWLEDYRERLAMKRK